MSGNRSTAKRQRDGDAIYFALEEISGVAGLNHGIFVEATFNALDWMDADPTRTLDEGIAHAWAEVEGANR